MTLKRQLIGMVIHTIIIIYKLY